MHVFVYVCIHIFMYVCMHVCMHVCMYACMHVCIILVYHLYLRVTCIYTCEHGVNIYIYTHIDLPLVCQGLRFRNMCASILLLRLGLMPRAWGCRVLVDCNCSQNCNHPEVDGIRTIRLYRMGNNIIWFIQRSYSINSRTAAFI